MKPFERLAPGQQHFLLVTVELLCTLGRMPTLREWAGRLGSPHAGACACHLHALSAFGWLARKSFSRAGCWELTPAALAWFRSADRTPAGIRLRLLAPEVTLTPTEARELGERLLALALAAQMESDRAQRPQQQRLPATPG